MASIHAKRLKEARTNAKLTQIEVYNQTGINNKTLSGYEKDVSEPDYDTLRVLCTLYGVSPDWVLGHTNSPNSELNPEERELVKKIELGDDSFVESSISLDGRELTKEQKEKLQAMARLLLQQDR